MTLLTLPMPHGQNETNQTNTIKLHNSLISLTSTHIPSPLLPKYSVLLGNTWHIKKIPLVNDYDVFNNYYAP